MKKLILLLIALAVGLTAIPAARAHDDDPWHEAGKKLGELDVRMDKVYDLRAHYGASPKMRDQIAELHDGIQDVTDHVKYHSGDGRMVRDRATVLEALMAQVEAEYHDRIHGGHDIVIHVN
jgi:hypothetical protein